MSRTIRRKGMKKGWTTKYSPDRKFVGYLFDGKIYRTKLMFERAWKKRAGIRAGNFQATPIYKKK